MAVIYYFLESRVRPWVPILCAIFTSLLFLWHLPLQMLATIFRQPPVLKMMQASTFFTAFVGHFIGSGLMEELFKILPVCVVFSLLYVGRRQSKERAWLRTPRLWILLGAASATGFTIMETLIDYLPKLQGSEALSKGMMLLIPRLFTGICGHIAWSGIFAYLIGLALFSRRSYIPLVLGGWFASSLLHALWNASDAAGLPLISVLVSMGTFGLFIAQFVHAKELIPRTKAIKQRIGNSFAL